MVLGAKLNSVQEATIIHEAPLPFPASSSRIPPSAPLLLTGCLLADPCYCLSLHRGQAGTWVTVQDLEGSQWQCVCRGWWAGEGKEKQPVASSSRWVPRCKVWHDRGECFPRWTLWTCGVPASVSGDSTVRWDVSAFILECQCTVKGQRVSGKRRHFLSCRDLQPLLAFCSRHKHSPIRFFNFSGALSSRGNGADGSSLTGAFWPCH